VTNSSTHLQELLDLYARVLQTLGVDAMPYPSPAHRFGRENGAELLGVAFDNITRRDANSELVVPTAEPIVRYFRSLSALRMSALPQGMTWDDVMVEVERTTRVMLETEGVVRIRTAVSLFECR
jgi:hypothetical protein